MSQPPLTERESEIIQNNYLIANTLKAIAAAGITAAGIGGGWRGLLGLRDMVFRKKELPPILPHEVPIEVLAPDEEEKQAEETDIDSLRRFPETQPWWIRWALRKYDDITNKWTPAKYLLGQGTEGVEGEPDFHPKKPLDMPLALPLAAGVTSGGAYGGYKLLDWLLSSNRAKRLDEELEEAKAEFRTALQQQYAGAKRANVTHTADELEQLWNHTQPTMVKEAEVGSDWVATVLGPYLLYAAATGGLSAAVVYKAMRKRQQEKLLEEASKVRGRRTWYTQPPVSVAELAPTEVA